MPLDTLLILDLDDTLIHGERTPTGAPVLLTIPGMPFPYLYARPHCQAFLQAAAEQYTLGVWTAAVGMYAQAVVTALFSDPAVLHCIYDRTRCTVRPVDGSSPMIIKPLTKITGFPLAHMLILDDTPATYQQNYGNALPIPPWHGDSTDDALVRLLPFLAYLATVPDVRVVEKRDWWQNTTPRRTP